MIKLIALDMDGTLLNSQKEIPKAHIQAIHQAVEHGVKLVLCTGRPLVGVKPYYEQLGLSGDNEYVIINNGCSTHQTKDWKLVAWKELSVEDILYLDKISKQTPVQLTLFDEERYLVVDEKPSELVTYDASLVFTTPTEISLKEAISGKNIMFQAMFLAHANNDIEMLEFAGFGVAMGNSSDYVKKLADYVTDSNDENGVATAIEKLILNN